MKLMKILMLLLVSISLAGIGGCAGKKKLTPEERRYNLSINKKARATAERLRQLGHERWCQHQRDQGDEPDDDCN